MIHLILKCTFEFDVMLKDKDRIRSTLDFDVVLRRDFGRNLDLADAQRATDAAEKEQEDDGWRPGGQWCNESRDDRLDEPLGLNQRVAN